MAAYYPNRDSYTRPNFQFLLMILCVLTLQCYIEFAEIG